MTLVTIADITRGSLQFSQFFHCWPGIKERKSACAIISRFNMNISPPIKGLTGDGSDADNDDDGDHCDCL